MKKYLLIMLSIALLIMVGCSGASSEPSHITTKTDEFVNKDGNRIRRTITVIDGVEKIDDEIIGKIPPIDVFRAASINYYGWLYEAPAGGEVITKNGKAFDENGIPVVPKYIGEKDGYSLSGKRTTPINREGYPFKKTVLGKSVAKDGDKFLVSLTNGEISKYGKIIDEGILTVDQKSWKAFEKNAKDKYEALKNDNGKTPETASYKKISDELKLNEKSLKELNNKNLLAILKEKYPEEEYNEETLSHLRAAALLTKYENSSDILMEEGVLLSLLDAGWLDTTYELENSIFSTPSSTTPSSAGTSSGKVKQEITDLKKQVAANTKRIEEVAKENRQGIALTTAMAQINPLGINEGTFSAGVGLGYFKGETGLAIGVGYGISEGISVSSKVAFAFDDFSTFAIGAGVNFEF